MKIESLSCVLKEMHEDYKSLLNGKTVILERPIKYRNSPHECDIILSELKPTDDFRYNRQLLAAINQRLRMLKYEDCKLRQGE